MPLASVVIPNWNGAGYLSRCLESLERQTFRGFEVIVVDNGSRDESVQLVQERFPWASVLSLKDNRGFAGAANAGLAKARGEVLVLLNNDTEAEPQWLESLLDALLSEPDCGMAASRVRLLGRRSALHSAGDLYGKDGLPRNRGVWEEDKGQYNKRDYVFGPCGAAAAYRRTLFADIGWFDERFFMYLEDVDIAWRAQLAGARCVYEPNAIVYHQLSATGGGPLASYYTGRNTLAVLVKNMPSPLIRRHWRAIVLAQLRIAMEALRSWKGEAARARLRGQLAGIAFARRLLPDRRWIQARRSASLEYLEGLLV